VIAEDVLTVTVTIAVWLFVRLPYL